MLVIVDVIIGKNGISTEVFSNIQDARKFRDKLKQKYSDEYTICEMAKNVNESLSNSILNRY